MIIIASKRRDFGKNFFRLYKVWIKNLFFLLILFIFILFTFNNPIPVKANYETISYPEVLFPDSNPEQTLTPKQINTVIFSPIKLTDKKRYDYKNISEEIIYFFSKFKFKTVPPAFIIYESNDDSDIESRVHLLNENWATIQATNNLNSGTLHILLGYWSDNFDISNFESEVKYFEKEYLAKIIKFIPANTLELRDFNIEVTENNSLLNFSETKNNSELLSYTSQLDLITKDVPEIEIQPSEINISEVQNSVNEIKISISNPNSFPIIFSPTIPANLQSKENSNFFINDDWQSLKTIKSFNEGFILPNSSKEFTLRLKTPLVPGDYSEIFDFFFQGKSVDSIEIKVISKDNNLKVLQVLETGLGYLNVREQADNNSKLIGDVSTGEFLIFEEETNGYYKVILNDNNKTKGWVSSRFIRIINND